MEPRTRTIDLESSFRLWTSQTETTQASSTGSPLLQQASRPHPVVPQKISNSSFSQDDQRSVPPSPPSHRITLTHSDSPPLLRRGNAGGLPPPPPRPPRNLLQRPTPPLPSTSHRLLESSGSKQSLPSTHTTNNVLMHNQKVSVVAPTTTSTSEGPRPMTRSMRIEALQFSHFRLLPHPIMVRLCVAASNLNVEVRSNETVRQARESTYFYMYSIEPRMILEGGEHRYPWGPIHRQMAKYVDELRRTSGMVMPFFLLQHIHTGAFLCPGDDVYLEEVFDELEAVHCTKLVCQTTRDLANCLLTVDDQFTQSRTKLYLRFFRNELKSKFICFIGDNELFCCEYPVQSAMLVVHQLFSGQPERLCLRCRQWYHGARGSQQRDHPAEDKSPGGCDHFSHVDEVMEQISPYT